MWAQHGIKRLGLVGFASLFLVAIWFRVSDLEAVPEHNGDESYYGIQAERLERGEAIALRTTSGNVLNPFLLGLALPLHAIATPSLTLLRIPSIVSSVLAVVLMLTLGSRAFDRTTALIAATLLAVLPILVFESRVGLEMSQQPFFGVLTIALAFLGNEIGLLLALLASMLVHPTDVFLLPMAIPVYVVRVCQRYADDPEKRRRVLLRCGAATLILGAVVSVWLLQSPTAQMNLRQRDPLHWRRFLDGIERLLFFLYSSVSPATMNLHRYLFRGLTLIAFAVGLRVLVREREPARIVFLVSLAASLAGFHILAGPTILRRFPTHRYGMVFVVPIVLGFAFLARGFWPRSGTEARVRVVPTLGLLAIGWALLLSMKWNYFDRVAPPGNEPCSAARAGTRIRSHGRSRRSATTWRGRAAHPGASRRRRWGPCRSSRSSPMITGPACRFRTWPTDAPSCRSACSSTWTACAFRIQKAGTPRTRTGSAIGFWRGPTSSSTWGLRSPWEERSSRRS